MTYLFIINSSTAVSAVRGEANCIIFELSYASTVEYLIHLYINDIGYRSCYIFSGT
jgi:hypothetical protein